jgi:hypothetical protein
MNSIKHKRAFQKALAVLAVSITAVVSTPSAYAYTCPEKATCFKDFESGRWGKIFGNNRHWGDFGWNDRADYFYNNGRTHDICLYQHAATDPRGRGSHVRLPKGRWVIWHNIVSSNVWTKGSCY